MNMTKPNRLMNRLEQIKKWIEEEQGNWNLSTKENLAYIIRIAECAEDFNNSLKGKTGAILGGTSFGKLDKLREALGIKDD